MNIIKNFQKLIRNIFIIILIVIFTLAFSGSYRSLSVDNLAFVVALGIDIGTNDNLKVTFEFAKVSSISSGESPSSESNTSVINSVEASSIESAITIMNSYIGKKVNLSHCKVLVFSEQLASNGISKEVYTLMNQSQIRPSSNIVISKCDANTYIRKSEPNLENLSSKYYEIFAHSGEYTGYVVNSTIGDFFNALNCDACSAYAILGGLNSQNDSSYKIDGKRETENLGLAIFKEDKLVGELSSMDTLSFSILENQVDGFLLSIPFQESHEDSISTGIDVYLQPISTPNINISISNGSPYIKVDCKFTGKIYSMDYGSDYLSEDFLLNLSQRTNAYISSMLTSYLYSTSLEYKTDINGFGRRAYSLFTTQNELYNFDWVNNYQNSTFKVTVNANVESGFLITKS